jgi:hypothetical protein
MHENFPENLRNPARDRRAGAMRQLPIGQVYSNETALTNKFIQQSSGFIVKQYSTNLVW